MSDALLFKGITLTATTEKETDRLHNVPQGEAGGIILTFKDRGIRILSVAGSRKGHCPSVAYNAPRQVWVETLKAVALLKNLPNWRGVSSADEIRNWIEWRWNDIRGGIR